jgi:LacI family transcriptional regulator
MASGVEEELTKAGLDLIIATARDDGDREKDLIESLLERRVRGLIIIPSGHDYSYLHLERKRGFSFVFADRPPAYLDADMVLADNQGGIDECVAYLVSKGCTRLALIADKTEIWTATERIQGFKKAVTAHGLQAANSKVISGIHTSEQAENVAQDLINHNQPYDGVIATNDLIAIGVGHALATGSSDIHMVSFDEFPASRTMKIPTLNHDPKRIGKAAALALLDRIEHPTDENFVTHTIELNLNNQNNEVLR